jgi:hypothetical protein
MIARLRQPGLLRGGWMLVLGLLFSIGLSVITRLAYGLDDLWYADAWGIIALIAAPLFFLVGIGACDYWC